jgi:hypothetical protein
MKLLDNLLSFDAYILEEGSSQRNAVIATAVSRLKEKFGDTKEKFLECAKERGVEEIKDFILQTLEPYIERIESQEKLQNGRPTFDYDGMLAGLVSWFLVEIEVGKMKKSKKTNNNA